MPSRRTSTTIAALALAALLALPAPTATAWSNGRSGPNSYGTHDWILDFPIRRLNKHNNLVEWVRLGVARKATDNPDTKNGIAYASSPWWHVYDIWGQEYGGAPKAVRHWFHVAARRLAEGRRRDASKALGIMSHLLGDLANPMHTDGWKIEDDIHAPYERDVDEDSGRHDGVYGFRYNGRDAAAPYRQAVTLAKGAHEKYAALVRKYRRYGFDSRRVRMITYKQLERAANAVADVAVGIKAEAKRIRRKQNNGGGGGGCDPSYPDFCIPPPPPDKDCDDVNGSNFTVNGDDPHGFDGNNDGVGCES